ncbi:MAG: ABC transporter ATP-binding protein [Clostridiales bacterium]|jgi:branched-chain amino acid transport system ATP-binding protein|nr:ABC transporter ATP-binding protein [Clostridiales bacterium]
MKAWRAIEGFFVKRYRLFLFDLYNGRLIRWYRQKKNNALLNAPRRDEKCDAQIAKCVARIKLLKQKLGRAEDEQLSEGAVLRLDGLCMYFGGVKAVDGLSFEIGQGEIFGLIGPNGAGKTTVFNCITQFYEPTRGSILYRNGADVQNLTDLKVHNVIPLGISRTFQNVETIWELTVLENVMIGAHANFMTGLFAHMFHLPALKREERAIRAKALKVLEYMDISAYAGFYAYGLPYGVLKKIEIARALMCDPQFLILDEPAAGMNEAETKELARMIKRIRDDYRCTVFLVEHDMGLVMDVCERICAISFGKMLAIGTPKEIQGNKAVVEAYLGSSDE